MAEEAATPNAAAPEADGEKSGGIKLDAKRWTDTFEMLQEGGLADRGHYFALTVATLKRKGEDVQQQIDALRLAEDNLLQAARDEIEDSRGKAEEGSRPLRDAKQAKTWGMALASAVVEQAREASDEAASEEPPYASIEMAQESEQQVASTLEAHRRAQQEAEAQAIAEAQQVLLMQAQAVAQAQAIAEEQAQALQQAQAQAEVVAQLQAQLNAEATMAQEAQAEQEAQAVERNALRAQGLNSKKLPLRPSVPACSFYMRTGDCKYGRTCKWDHPENSVNSKGYPMRPGETPCAFYLRTGICKFSATCKFDHPEKVTPTMPGLDAALGAVPGLDAAGLLAALGGAALGGPAAPMPAPPKEPPPPGTVAAAAAVAAVQAAAAAVVQNVAAGTAPTAPPGQPPPPPLPAASVPGGIDPAQMAILVEQLKANTKDQAITSSDAPLSDEEEKLVKMMLQQAQQDLSGAAPLAVVP